MADYARALISKIIEEEGLVDAMGNGVATSWFEEEQHRDVYTWMLDYHSRYGLTPTETALRHQFPSYRLIVVSEPFVYYLDKFKDQRHRTILVDTVIGADEALKTNDFDAAQQHLSEGLLMVGTEMSVLTDKNVTQKLKVRFDEYEDRRKNAGKITGIRTGFPTLDFISGGYHPQQFIILAGAPKQTKSYVLMKSAIAAQEQGNRVLFLSFEMSAFEQQCRYDAIVCGINSNRLLRGNLTDEDMKKLRRGLGSIRNLPPFIISADISASTTISGLAAKIDQHQPDIIFVDGIYLMDSESSADPMSSQALTAISRGLKRLAQRLNKPLIGTHQCLTSKMSKGVVTLYSLGYASAFSQDADLVLGVERVEGAPMINLRVVAGRNVSPREIILAVNWEESIFEEAETRDDEEEDE